MSTKIIYKLTNLITEDFYIGQTRSLNRRRNEHFSRLRCGKHSNINITGLFELYGVDSFEIEPILYCEDFEADRYEQALVDKWKPTLNLWKKCVLSPKGYTPRLTTKKKQSMVRRGKHQGNNVFGHTVSQETREKISYSLRKGEIR